MTSNVAILQATHDGPISPEQWQAAERADELARRRRTPRVQRLERIYNRTSDRAIGSTDGRTLATATLAHWCYCRATDGYDGQRMIDDCLYMQSRATTYSQRSQWCARLAGGDVWRMAAE